MSFTVIDRLGNLKGLGSPHVHAEADVTGLVADLAARAGLRNESTITTTGTQNALALPTGTGDLVIFANNATLLTVQGIAAGLAGQRLTIISKGAGQVNFVHAAGFGTAPLVLFATSGVTSLAAGSGVASFVYDLTLTKWRLVAHEQGAWIAVPYVAGNFTATAPMTWTVDSGDAVTNRYWLKGRTLTVNIALYPTTLGGTATASCLLAVPAGFVCATFSFNVVLNVQDNGGAAQPGEVVTAVGGTKFELWKVPEVNYLLGTNLTAHFGTFSVEVQ